MAINGMLVTKLLSSNPTKILNPYNSNLFVSLEEIPDSCYYYLLLSSQCSLLHHYPIPI